MPGGYIEGAPLMLSPGDIARINAGGGPGGPPGGGGGREIFYDSSADRAAYIEQFGAPPGIEIPASEIANLPPPVPPVTNEPPVNDAIMRAAVEGRPLTPEMMQQMPPPFMQNPPQQARPSRAAQQPPPFMLQQPGLNQQRRPIDPTLEHPGLVVRVGRGITATVAFSAEPTKKHWERLQRFIEVMAEETEDGPEPEWTRPDVQPEPVPQSFLPVQPMSPAPATPRRRRRSKERASENGSDQPQGSDAPAG